LCQQHPHILLQRLQSANLGSYGLFGSSKLRFVLFPAALCRIRQYTSAYVSIGQLTDCSAAATYVSMREHT
jgi:hypothetical protein